MKEVLLSLARASIKSSLESKEVDTNGLADEYPYLLEEGACFVTLSINGRLRGCIGSILARRPLLEDLLSNARAAAFNDPRFSPLSAEEFEQVKIEVSILTPPRELEYKDVSELRTKIRIGIDGVILKKGFHQATFLPQVWEDLPSFDLFFSHLCQKAGLSGSCIEGHPDISIYQVEKVSE